MLNNFIYAQKKSLFTKELEAGNVPDEAIAFIEDTKEIWNRGIYFAGNKVDLSNIENIINNKIGTGLQVNDGKIELTQQVLTNLGLGEPLPFDNTVSVFDSSNFLDTSEVLEGYSIRYNMGIPHMFVYYKDGNSSVYKTFPGYEKYSKELNPHQLFIYNGILYKHGKEDQMLQRLYSMDSIGDIEQSLQQYIDNELQDITGGLTMEESLSIATASRMLCTLSYTTEDKSQLSGEPIIPELLELYDSLPLGYPLYGFSILNDTELVLSFYIEGGLIVTTSLGTYGLQRNEDNGTFVGTLLYPNLALEQKQDILISGENIKTINGQSILGSGDITISDGGNNGDLSNYVTKTELAAVATSGSYNDLTNKPTIPAAVTESTVSAWGFTKNTGTYIKPSTGIPKSDLSSETQETLNKVDVFNVIAVDTNEELGDVIVPEDQAPTVNLQNYYTKQQIDDIQYVSESQLSAVATSGSYNDLSDKPLMKTINGESILGEGDISSGFIKGEGEDSAILKGSTNSYATGHNSIAGGMLANANGEYSVAFGRGCEANGNYSVALGGLINAITLSGEAGTITYTTTSKGVNDALVGRNIALADDTYNNKIAKILSVSGNKITVDTTLSADQDLSNVKFAITCCSSEGKGAMSLGGPLKASGTYAIAEGYKTYAKGNYSHSEGNNTISAGNSSHAEGYLTSAIGDFSHAEGCFSGAIGNYSHAENCGCLIKIYLTGSNSIYTINKGTSFQNFVYVDKLKTKYIVDPSTYIKIANITSVVVGEDGYTITVTLDTDLGELNNKVYGVVDTLAYGAYSHAQNIGTAYGDASHAGGYSSSVGEYTFSHGNYSVADGTTSAVFGTNNYTQNNSEFALGISNHSHTGDSSAEQTLFSVGCGDWQEMGMDVRIANQIPLPTPEDGKNAIEIMRNGDVWLGDYGNGVKLYDGEKNKIELSDYYNKSEIDTKVNNKQDTLVSGTNIKTINGTSILGSGDINISGNGSADLSNYYTKDEINSILGNINSVLESIIGREDDFN